jgi:hypothetical protein
VGYLGGLAKAFPAIAMEREILSPGAAKLDSMVETNYIFSEMNGGGCDHGRERGPAW